ncbi:hypothetical protein J4225_03940 [Candidatus Pacearchaeota archaeon]|nr:hypothetical protein [Candidatus Pacearchaeota archaeon]
MTRNRERYFISEHDASSAEADSSLLDRIGNKIMEIPGIKKVIIDTTNFIVNGQVKKRINFGVLGCLERPELYSVYDVIAENLGYCSIKHIEPKIPAELDGERRVYVQELRQAYNPLKNSETGLGAILQ